MHGIMSYVSVAYLLSKCPNMRRAIDSWRRRRMNLPQGKRAALDLESLG